jgi:hypothetical protein
MPKNDDGSNSLRLSFSAAADTVIGLGVEHYVASIQDAAGSIVFELRLPAALVESVAFSSAGLKIAMSPDGMISVVDDRPEGISGIDNGISIDALIEQSVVPAMLEDEIDAERQLDDLRDRLTRALLVVSAAKIGLR